MEREMCKRRREGRDAVIVSKADTRELQFDGIVGAQQAEPKRMLMACSGEARN